MSGNGGNGGIRSNELGECRPRPSAAQHESVHRNPQCPGCTFLYLARTVGCLSSGFYLFGKRRSTQHLRQSQQARLRRLADDVFCGRFGHPFLDQPVYHQLLHAVVHIGIGKVTAQFLRQFVVPLPADFLHDGMTPLSGDTGKVMLHLVGRDDFLPAHRDVVLGGFRVPFSRDLEGLVRVAERLTRRRHHAEYAADGGGVFLHLLALFLVQVRLRLFHDGNYVADEIVVHKGFRLRKLSAMFYSFHYVVISYQVHLFQ